MRSHLLRAAAGTAASSGGSGSGSSIINTDLYINYDFSDTNCWNRQNGTNTNDYTVHNLANDYNDGLFRSRTGTSDAYRNASDSPVIDFNSSDGGGCLEFNLSNLSSNTDDCILMIPGSLTSSSSASFVYNAPTVSATDSNNVFNGIGTGAFTIEFWYKIYVDHSHNARTYFSIFVNKDPSNSTKSIAHNYASPIYTNTSLRNKLYIGTDSSERLSDAIIGTPSSGAAWSDWNHHVYSRNSSATNDTKVYINNSLVFTGTDSDNYDYTQVGYIGRLWTAYESSTRHGIFRFYRGKALTASEVTTNWNAQKSRFGH